jgi:hypothetical protein
VVALLLTGCGSTALRGGVAAPDAQGVDIVDGTTGGVDIPGGSTGGTTGGATGSATGGSTGVAFGTTGSSGTTGATGGGASGATGGSTTGGTTSKKPLRVGIPGADVTAIFAAFGKADQAPDDPYATIRALIKYINEHGGVGGRPIVPVIHNVDATGDTSTEQQKACQDFTQDNKVDIVLDGLGMPLLAACLAKAGIADIGTTLYLPDAEDLAKAPNWMIPTAMRIDRVIRGLLQVVDAQGTLKKGDTLGVMVEDCPYGHRTYDNIVVPFAKQRGITLIQSSVKCLTNLAQDIAPITNDVQRAVLAFNGRATHVTTIHNAEAFIISNFTQNAKQQQYFPKYLVTHNAYPWQNAHDEATIKIDPSALPNMSGVGAYPLLAVGSAYKPAGAQKSLMDLCTKIDPTQGTARDAKDYNKPFVQNIFFAGCEGIFDLKAIVEAAGGNLDYRALRQGFAKLKGQGHLSLVLENARLAGDANSTDGAGFMRAFKWDTSRKTFVYAGSSLAVS